MEATGGAVAGRTSLKIKQGQKAWKYIYASNSTDSRDLNRIALRDGRTDYTYGSMFHQWERYAAVFSALGMTEENHSRVGLMGSTCAEVIFSFYGLNMTGAEVSLVPVFSSFNPKRVLKTIREEKLTDFIFTDDFPQPNLLHALFRHKKELGLRNIIYLHTPIAGPAVPTALTAMQDGKGMNSLYQYYPICMDTLLAAHGNGPVCYASDESHDPAFILHTSGTTGGTGRPVVMSDKAFNAAVTGFMKLDEFAAVMESPVSSLSVDLSSAYGIIDQVHVPLTFGATIITVPGGTLNPFFHKAIPAFGITFLFGNGAVLEGFMKMPETTCFDFSSLRCVVVGGSPVSSGDKHRYYEFLQKHGAGDELLFINGYGLSELGGACCLSTPDLDDDSIGYPLPGVDVRLFDEDTETFRTPKDAPCTGVLYLSSGSVASRFLDDKEILKTETISRKPFVCSNDLVRMDADGRITYLGRANRFFLHEDGRKYESGRVENEVSRQDGIESCGIIPVLQKFNHDTIPMLCVKTLEGDKQAPETARKALVQVFCTERTLEPDQLPIRVMIAEDLPRNANGKIDLYAINQGQVSGQQYEVKPVFFQERLTDIKLKLIDEGSQDMILDVFRGIAADLKADMKENLPNPHKTNALNEMFNGMFNQNKEDASMMNQNFNPFNFFSGMNPGANPFNFFNGMNQGANPFNFFNGMNQGANPFNLFNGMNQGANPFNFFNGMNQGVNPSANPANMNQGANPSAGFANMNQGQNPFNFFNGFGQGATPFNCFNNMNQGANPSANSANMNQGQNPFNFFNGFGQGANPFNCFNNMNQGANPSANSANMNQGGNPSGMAQNFGPGMQRMRQWITWMNQLNQAYWQMMLQMYMQNLQMMGQFCQMVQNTMPKTGADGNQEQAQDSPAVPAPESAEA